MSIVFDGAGLAPPVTGVGRAFLTALAAYLPLSPQRPLLLLPAGAADPALPGLDVVPAPRGPLRRQLQLPPLLRKLGAVLLHSSVASIPLRAPCPAIATVHDLPWLHAESGERDRRWRRFATGAALRAAAAVIAPSQFTLAAARRLLGARGARVRHVPHGVATPPSPPPAANRTGPLLALGDDRPRKNRSRVAAAHELARASCPDLPPLRFVGPPDDYVSEADKAALLQQCRALVQCSLFEGFGLPLLEGLAHGAPVVCSELPPFREIAGDAALFVDPHDPAAIAAALLRIHTDAALRTRLAAAGPQRAAALTPQQTAQQWLQLHRELLP